MDENFCRIFKHDLLFEFRLTGAGRIERRILNTDGSQIDRTISRWKPASEAVIVSTQNEHPKFKSWMKKRNSLT